MNVERLLRLADELDLVQQNPPPNFEFDMSSWQKKFDTCQTAGCACYVASTIPEFAKAGLIMHSVCTDIFVLRYQRFSELEAAEVFFNINTDIAKELFMQCSYYKDGIYKIKPKHVADRIRNIAGKEEPSEWRPDLRVRQFPAVEAR